MFSCDVSNLKCVKRNGAVTPFRVDKIRTAVMRCLEEVGTENAATMADLIALNVMTKLIMSGRTQFAVETVQRAVIQWMWANDLCDEAESYQNYREHRRKRRDHETSAAFDTRLSFKPFDYPEVEEFKKAIQQCYWTVDDVVFDSDVQDYMVHMTLPERSAAANAVLAISQIEVSVKKFWTRIGDRFRRPEFEQVGVTMGENEVRHGDVYSALLKALDLEDRFLKLQDVPAIQSRVAYLTRVLSSSRTGTDRDFVTSLVVFSLFIENVSLFAQFAVMKSFTKHRGLLHRVDTAVSYTMKEELIHAQFGAWLINLVRSDRPEWFGPEYYAKIADVCADALKAEIQIIDWIYEAGELPYLPRTALIEFVKDRVNDGIKSIGGSDVFEVDRKLLEPLRWLVEEIYVPVDVDKFHKRSVNYTSHNKADSAEELFG
jgi:ribonucleoside-diphosphate reductase beta chain